MFLSAAVGKAAPLPCRAAAPWMADAAASLAVGFCALACYLWSAPRTVVLEDDGYFLQAAWFNAVAHPPGYPLYVALSHLATLVPFGTVAFRVHAVTGLFAALACVLLFHFARGLDLRRAVAVILALAFAVSGAFWSQAIIAEVYSLNVLLFLACAGIGLQLGRSPESVTPRACVLFGFLYGLGLANHWPLLVLSTPALLLLVWPARRGLLRGGAMLAAGVGTGLLPYAWMIWRTHVVPEYCFAGPIASWQDFRFYVAREGYAAMDRNPGADWVDRIQFAGFVVRETVRQFGWAGAALGALGLARQWRVWAPYVCWFLLLGFLGSTLLLILLLGFDYDELHRNTFRVYPLISYAVVALWIGLGLQQALQICEGRLQAHLGPRTLAAALGLVLVGSSFIAHLPANFRRHNLWAEHYALVVLGSLPAGARFYGNADTVNGPVAYLHRVLGLRPDVTFVTGTGLPFDGRLYRPYALPLTELESLISAYVRSESRPMFYSNGFPQPFGQDDYGLYFGVNTAAARGNYRAAVSPAIVEYYRVLDAVAPPPDPWESMHFRLLRQDQCRWTVALASTLPSVADLPEACRGLQGRLWLAQQLVPAGSQTAGVILEWLPDSETILAQAITKSEQAHYLWLRALTLSQTGDAMGAQRAVARAWAAWRSPANPAHMGLPSARSR